MKCPEGEESEVWANIENMVLDESFFFIDCMGVF